MDGGSSSLSVAPALATWPEFARVGGPSLPDPWAAAGRGGVGASSGAQASAGTKAQSRRRGRGAGAASSGPEVGLDRSARPWPRRAGRRHGLVVWWNDYCSWREAFWMRTILRLTLPHALCVGCFFRSMLALPSCRSACTATTLPMVCRACRPRTPQPRAAAAAPAPAALQGPQQQGWHAQPAEPPPLRPQRCVNTPLPAALLGREAAVGLAQQQHRLPQRAWAGRAAAQHQCRPGTWAAVLGVGSCPTPRCGSCGSELQAN